jgi:hypothetical protein
MKCVIHRQNSSPNNAGHWQSSSALAVLLGRVSPRLREKSTNTFGESHTTSLLTQELPGVVTGIGDVLNDRKNLTPSTDSVAERPDSRSNQLLQDVQGTSRPLSGTSESKSTGKRLSANKGTRETRLSMVVIKHLPMRQPSGGAPVVVRDANDVHMAKGCRMIRDWMTEVFFNLEASK